MLYPQDIESKLGFDTIKQNLVNKCLSPLGVEKASKIRFSNDFDLIKRWLRQTDEFRKILISGDNFPSQHFIDVRGAVAKSRTEGAFLTSQEFLNIHNSLDTIITVRNFLSSHKEEYPELHELIHFIDVDRQLLQLISSKIDDDGNVRDSASAELGEIRKNIKIKYNKVRRSLESIYKAAVKDGFVPEGATITVRDGRMVVPINAEHKRRLRGFVHDESSTGQTVFLEPADVLDGNNEIRELEYAEKREVVKILLHLTDAVRREAPTLSQAYKFLGIIDFIRAKAKMAIELEAFLPALKNEPALEWEDARHPLLFLSHQKLNKKIVPLNIQLNHQQRVLIISGPNAGGKSVCLKTVGLIQYMLQCGILPSVSEASEFGIFKDIFIDIGDEQSIENDLSTYSSHLTNMKHFLKKSGDQTLSLIDEFGTGTDPQFGGAIAEAVLDKLFEREGYGVITTHYSNIKHYAESKPGMVNGAMKFDMVNLEPLYELEMGKPGSSFSLEIARKIGLSHHVINYAKETIGEKNIDVDDLLLKLEKQKQQIKERDIKLKEREREVKEIEAKYKSLFTQLEENKKKILDSAKKEAQTLLKDTNREIEKTIRHIQENKAQKQETKKARERLGKLKEKVEVPIKAPKQTVKVIEGEIKVGDSVRIIGQEVAGKVLQLKGKGAEVQMGGLKSTIKISRLEKISNAKLKEIKKPKTAATRGLNLNQKMSDFNMTLDVRGKRAEEVLGLVDKFIDDALLVGSSEVKILHGKGSGILKDLIRNHLRGSSYIASVQDEHVERGGAGITVLGLS